MTVGKLLRLYRIINPKSRETIIVPMDHGGFGMLEGLEDIRNAVHKVVEGGANAVVLQQGAAIAACNEIMGKAGLILRISRVTVFNEEVGLYEAPSYSVEGALRLGADAVIVSYYVGGKREFESLKDASRIADDCAKWGVPFLVEALPSQDKFKSFDDPECVKWACRSAAELGADMIKAYLPNDVDYMKEVVRVTPVPIVLAGGEVASVREVLEKTKNAMDAGLAGLCYGRKIFKYRDPTLMVKALSKIVHEKYEINEVLKEFPELR